MLSLPAYILLSVFGWRTTRVNSSADEHIEALSVENIYQQLHKKSSPLLVDVRLKKRKKDYIKNSVHIPLEKIGNTIHEYAEKNTPLVVYCEDGSRSYQAAKLLHYLGYTSVMDMVGGMITWKDAGYPIEEVIISNEGKIKSN